MSPRVSRRRSTSRSRVPARWPAWVAIGAVLLAVAALQFYLIVFALPSQTFYSGDCGIKLAQAQSFVMQHWRSPALVYPGESIDPGHQFVETGGLIVRKGRVWGSHSVVFAFLSSIPYAWLGFKGLYVVPAISLLGAVFLLWLLARTIYGDWRALFAAALLAFCTPLLFYGVEFWEHTLAVFIAMAALLLLPLGLEAAKPAWRFAAASALLAAAFAVRPETAVLVAAVGLGMTATVRPARDFVRSLGFFALGVLSILAPLVLANQRLFGDPWGTLLGLHIRAGHPDPRMVVIGKLLMPLTFANLLELGGAALGALLVWWLATMETKLERGRLTVALSLLATGVVAAIAAVEGHRLLALWRKPEELTSLTASFPVVWALPMVATAWCCDAKAVGKTSVRFLAVTATVYLVGVLVTSPTWSGAQWGPRLLLLAMPLLALLLGRMGNPRLASGRVALLAVCSLALVSAGVQVTGLRWLAQTKGLYVNTVGLFERKTGKGDVLASDQFWLQEVLASLYYQRRFFYIASPDRMTEFVGRLRSSRVPRFYYLLPRSADYPGAPEKLTQDLVKQVEGHNLLEQGLVLEHCDVISDRPYYLLRLAVGTTAGSP